MLAIFSKILPSHSMARLVTEQPLTPEVAGHVSGG
jgi:hypothetical protein